jgi:F-type H+-transporting ATPase subunit c
VTHTNPTLLSSIVSLSLLGNHEEDSRTGLSGRGAAVGIGNVFSSLIHSVARNPSLAKQSFGYAILGFALTEAIASFASMMAFLISSVFRSKVEVSFILTTIFLKQIVHSAHSLDTVKANSCFHQTFLVFYCDLFPF